MERVSIQDPRYLASLIAFDPVAGAPFSQSDRSDAKALTGIFLNLADPNRKWIPGSDRRAETIVNRLVLVAKSGQPPTTRLRQMTTPAIRSVAVTPPNVAYLGSPDLECSRDEVEAHRINDRLEADWAAVAHERARRDEEERVRQQREHDELEQRIHRRKEQREQQALATKRAREQQEALAAKRAREQQEALAAKRAREQQEALAAKRAREQQEALAAKRAHAVETLHMQYKEDLAQWEALPWLRRQGAWRPQEPFDWSRSFAGHSQPPDWKVELLARQYGALLCRELSAMEETFLRHAVRCTYLHCTANGLRPSGDELLGLLRNWVAYLETHQAAPG